MTILLLLALICSNNGRYCVEQADVRYSDPERYDGGVRPLSLLEHQANGSYVVLRELLTDPLFDAALVSDDGRFIVSVGQTITILRNDGRIVRRMELDELITRNDLYGPPPFPLRRWSIKTDRLVLTVPASITTGDDALYEDVEIDLERGELLTLKHDIYPPLRVYARAEKADEPPVPEEAWDGPACSADGVERMTSEELLASAVETSIPQYPDIAGKVRIGGAVRIDVVVDERGRVVCSRVKRFAFGVSDAVERALLAWRFRPRSSPVTGRFVMEFGRVEHAEWKRIVEEGPAGSPALH